MARIKPLKVTETELAVEKIAQYYRQSRLYLQESNSSDAYQFFIDTYTEDLRIIISQGFSYQFKGNYLVACDLTKLYEEHPDVAEHFFGIVPQIKQACEEQDRDTLFICAFGPNGDHIGLDGYNLIESFVKMHKEYIILTDCPAGYDMDVFCNYTTAKKVRVTYENAWRWS